MFTEVIQKVTEFLVAENVEAGLGLLYRSADQAFCEGKFSEVDEVLGPIDVEKSPLHLLIGLLTVTSWAKDKFPNRQKFYDRVLKHVGNENGVLNGLE